MKPCGPAHEAADFRFSEYGTGHTAQRPLLGHVQTRRTCRGTGVPPITSTGGDQKVLEPRSGDRGRRPQEMADTVHAVMSFHHQRKRGTRTFPHHLPGSPRGRGVRAPAAPSLPDLLYCSVLNYSHSLQRTQEIQQTVKNVKNCQVPPRNTRGDIATSLCLQSQTQTEGRTERQAEILL